MTYKFCLVPFDVVKKGAVGWAYAKENESKWEEYNPEPYLAAGYVKGVDHIIKDDKAYAIMKSYINLSENYILHICAESTQGCDIIEVTEEVVKTPEDNGEENPNEEETKEPELNPEEVTE